MEENRKRKEEGEQGKRGMEQKPETERNSEESGRGEKRMLWYGYIGAAAVVLFIVFGIIWQASGKTISETGREMDARKKSENTGKKGDGGKEERVTDGAVLAAVQDILDEPVKIVSGAAFEARAKREELLAQQAAAEAEAAARKKAEEEAVKKAEAEAKAKAEAEAAKKAKAEEEARKAAQRAQAEASVKEGGDDSEESGYVPPVSKPVQTADSNAYIDEVIRLVNAERANAGLAPLAKNGAACQAAKVRASEIGVSFSHTRPDGRTCFTALDEMGISYTACGENIAAGHPTPEAVVRGWMNSPGHRANILDESFEEIGIGVENVNGTMHWVQLFLRVNW